MTTKKKDELEQKLEAAQQHQDKKQITDDSSGDFR